MAAVKPFALVATTVAALLTSPPAHADAVANWRAPIAEASARFGIPIAWIERVMRAESAGLRMLGGRPITSRAGAMGLMQLMPGTWAEMRRRLGLGHDPHVPRDNILAGTAYLRLLYDRFGYPGLFAAYNAGPRRYTDYLTSRRPLPSETQFYLVAVAGERVKRDATIDRVPRDTLFFILASTPRIASPRRQAAPAGLFVSLERPVPAR